MSVTRYGSALHMLAAHLSVPYGPGAVTAEHIETLLQTGSFSGLEDAPEAAAIAHSLFTENARKRHTSRIRVGKISPVHDMTARNDILQQRESGVW